MACILIIDDDKQFQSMLTQLLERNGYGVINASSGKSGIEMLNSNSIDLVITDIIMPEKDGLETITELLENHPELKIIAVSGGGRTIPDNSLKAALMIGAVQSLKKPVDCEKILETIKNVIA